MTDHALPAGPSLPSALQTLWWSRPVPFHERSLDEARRLGFEALAAAQRAALDEVWARADIVLDGDPEVQHALRYALFQVHQNAACARGTAAGRCASTHREG